MNGPFKLVLYYTRLENLAIDKHSSFLGPFVNYKESVVNTTLEPMGKLSRVVIIYFFYLFLSSNAAWAWTVKTFYSCNYCRCAVSYCMLRYLSVSPLPTICEQG
jgi:hypothetical protein